jgi:adenine-specific DNA-methyltransferase
MAVRRKAGGTKRKAPRAERAIEQYEHVDKERANNPPVGLVNPQNDPDAGKKTWAYDPHLDPQLVWAGKAEHTSFEVPTVSLHVHERIDPKTIVEAVRRPAGEPEPVQPSLFAQPSENPPLRDALDFYRHPHGWSNRLVAGDSLLVMNSLLQKEGLGGKVQMVYLDPPYGIRYGSNFQPFVNRRDVEDGKDEDLTQEPEMIRAFRDTWELGIHSYLGYLRDRLLLARELLHESGSVFVQIGDENLHRVRCVLDEIFRAENFQAVISARKPAGLGAEGLVNVSDYVLWYAKDLAKLKTRTLFQNQDLSEDPNYVFLIDGAGKRRRLTEEEREEGQLPAGSRLFRHQIFLAAGRTPSCIYEIEFEGEKFLPTAGRSWSTNPEGAERLKLAKRLVKYGNQLTYVRHASDFRSGTSGRTRLPV